MTENCAVNIVETRDYTFFIPGSLIHVILNSPFYNDDDNA